MRVIIQFSIIAGSWKAGSSGRNTQLIPFIFGLRKSRLTFCPQKTLRPAFNMRCRKPLSIFGGAAESSRPQGRSWLLGSPIRQFSLAYFHSSIVYCYNERLDIEWGEGLCFSYIVAMLRIPSRLSVHPLIISFLSCCLVLYMTLLCLQNPQFTSGHGSTIPAISGLGLPLR